MWSKVMAGVVGGLVVASVSVGSALAEPSDQDTTWMVAAHQSNLAEIAAGTSAVARAESETVRSLGQMFVDMHTALDADLTAAAEQFDVELPESPTPSQQNGLAAVEAQDGAAFDTAWIANQIASHRTSLDGARTEISAGSDATVIALAQAAEPVVEQHLTSLEEAAADFGQPTLIQTGDGGLLEQDSTTLLPLLLAGGGAVLIGSGVVATWLRRRRA